MRIKKFAASSMKEALLQIRQDLGEEAMILKTRKVPKRLLPFGSGASVEVTAAVEEPVTALPRREEKNLLRENIQRRAPTVPVQREPQLPVKPAVQDKRIVQAPKAKHVQTPAIQVPGGDKPFEFLELREDLHQVKVLLASILATGESAAAGGFAGPWAILYKRLIDAEIRTDIAEDLIRKMKETIHTTDSAINRKCGEALSGCVPVSGPIAISERKPSVAALIGPTGVGKTTTIAKLAAYFSISKKFRVSIITIDTYRVAAVEQIRAFAEILNIKVQVVFSYDEIPQAMQNCTGDDLVFVDTAGRSHRNKEHIRDLELFLQALQPDETHLVVSATTKYTDLEDTLKRYVPLGINRLLFTKVDESHRIGNLFNIAYRSMVPVSYITTGQGIPEDIELAQPGRFVQRLLEGSSL